MRQISVLNSAQYSENTVIGYQMRKYEDKNLQREL